MDAGEADVGLGSESEDGFRDYSISDGDSSDIAASAPDLSANKASLDLSGDLTNDLPLSFHPAAIRASAVCTPSGAGGATGDRRSWSGLRRRSSVVGKLAA